MARRPGRPPNPTTIDDATMRVVRSALVDIARELGVPRGRFPDPDDPGRLKTQPEPLELAVLALRARDALELLAAENVNRARELNGVTWEQVGERFDISMQSAHSRFRRS
ncbi:MAG: hypothetical protein AB7O92_08330 [Acidimicrobiia bacterium]